MQSTQNEYMEEIKELHGRFGRKMTGEALEDYVECIIDFDIALVRTAIKNTRKSAKVLPTPVELKAACKRQKEYFEQKAPALKSDLVCRFSDAESEASASLCGTVDEDDLPACRLRGWPSLCRWHYDVMYEKALPGARAEFIRAMLESVARMPVKCDLKGISPQISKNPYTSDNRHSDFSGYIGS